MPKFKDYNQNQPMLLPPDIRQWLQPDHICFVINDVVDNLDVSGVKATYSDNGSPAYNPRALLKLMFFSYTQGIRSSRKIEKMAQESIVCRYLSANQQPDHSTINLFRKDHLVNLEDIFAQIVILCDGLNIIDPTNISIDGTILKASASKKKTYNQEQIAKLKKKIRGWLEESEQIDAEEDKRFGDKRGYNQMPDKLIDPKTRQKEIKRLQKKIEQLNQAEKAIKDKQKKAKTGEERKQTRNNTHNTTDKDAVLMKIKNGKTCRPGYNGQISTSKQIILAYDVSDEGSDARHLLPMVEKTENNTKKRVETTKADSVYFNKGNLRGLKKKKIDSYIPDQMKSIEEKQERDNTIPKYDRRNFTYDQKKDQFICPESKPLRYNSKDKKGRIYVGIECHSCSVKAKCTKGKKRTFRVDWQYEQDKAEMRKKLNSKLGKNKYLERMSDVEPPFGNIIYNQQAGHFLCRGRPMVKIEFGLSCSAHNLVKIANWSKRNDNKTQFATLMRLPAPTAGNQGQTELNFLLVFQGALRTFKTACKGR